MSTFLKIASAVPFLIMLGPPAPAETDLSGNWVTREHQDWQERGPGPEAVDYLGLPINAEARAVALSYQASLLSLPERQCLYYNQAYIAIGPFGLKMWSEVDPVTGKILAWKIGGVLDRAILTIWMDGRPHPPNDAVHPFEGFTTGEWEGNVLTTYTTHFKTGYLRRNGVPLSDRTVMTAHFIRHGDFLTVTELIEDPVYLTEPFIVSRTWQLDPNTQLSQLPPPCFPEAEVARLDGQSPIPHFLPGQNPYRNEMTKMYNIPEEAVMGGAETMYPEYRRKLKDKYIAPVKCVRYCCGWEGTVAQSTLRDCIGRGFASPDEPQGRR